MAVVRFDITKREPYAGGKTFGEIGSYERIDGIVHYAVDPDDPVNADIVDLNRAPRNDAGLVEFSGDLVLLTPKDMNRASGRAILENPNRGRMRLPYYLNRASGETASPSDIPEGDGFLFNRGYVVGFIGWQWDVIRGDGMLGLDAPQAMENNAPIRGRTIVEIYPNVEEKTRLLANRNHKPYPAINLDNDDATLWVRDWEDGPDTEIPRDQWGFMRESDRGVEPSENHVYLETGFQPGRIYRLVYTTEGAPVVGAGLLALRDVGSFLRYGTVTNPCAGKIDHTYIWGVSQSGRMLRNFIYLGLNSDEQGRDAYSGIIPHVAGGKRGEFNHRFAQPSVQTNPNFGHLFPFADEEMRDPYSGRTDGLLRKQRERGNVPKIVYVNSSAEYWRGDGSLSHTDPQGREDAPEAPEVRSYLFASTQHGIGVVPLTNFFPMDSNKARHAFNVVDYSPLLRAVVINLDRWCTEGVEPPPSQYPRIADGTAIPRWEVIEAFKRLPGIQTPDPDRLGFLRRVELGENAEEGIGQYPVTELETYHALVSAIDDDFNEVAGIRLPDLTVPLGTHTGWNPRHPSTGAPEQIVNMHGITRFFPRTEAERQELGDPRPSIEARYPDKETYLEQVRVAAVALIEAGYLLPEDISAVIGDSSDRYDTALSAPPGAGEDI